MKKLERSTLSLAEELWEHETMYLSLNETIEMARKYYISQLQCKPRDSVVELFRQTIGDVYEV